MREIKRYRPVFFAKRPHMHDSPKGNWFKLSDIQDIVSHLMAHSRDNGHGEVIINSGEFYETINQLKGEKRDSY